MTQEEMNRLVPEKLHWIEKEYDVQVLLAVESGSRAWGFASPDSDFDVRFIYKKPKDSYLQLHQSRDVIELPVDDTWDVNGWDLDKTLRLLYKSNPTLYEWVRSPICYCRTDFPDKIAPIMNAYFSVKNMVYHYLNTARHNMKAYLQGETVRPKKYFYAIRPILACYWVLHERTAPPVLFDELAEAFLPETLRSPLDYLLDIKLHTPEKAAITPIKEIDSYLSHSVQYLDDVMKGLPREEKKSWDLLNRFFIEEISGTPFKSAEYN